MAENTPQARETISLNIAETITVQAMQTSTDFCVEQIVAIEHSRSCPTQKTLILDDQMLIALNASR